MKKKYNWQKGKNVLYKYLRKQCDTISDASDKSQRKGQHYL